MIKAKDIMSQNIIFVTPTTSIIEASKIMKENNIGFLPIMDNDYIFGVVTDRDIVIRSVIYNSINDNISKYATTSPLYMAKEDTDICDIISLMNTNKIRRVLIVNEDKELKGIISLKDIILNSNIEEKIKGIFLDSCSNLLLNIDTTITL